MPFTREDKVRQSLFIFWRNSYFRKLRLPPDWRLAMVEDSKQLFSCMTNSSTSQRSILLIVGEEELEKPLGELKTKFSPAKLSKFGILVVSKDPQSFLQKNGHTPEVVEVVSPKLFSRWPQFYLMKSVLCLSRENASSRVSHQTLETLNQTFIALSSERDPKRLLASILAKSIELTNAEAGTLYMIREQDGEMFFRLKISMDNRHEVVLQPVDIKVSENSLCGYVALTGKPVNMRNMKELPPHPLFEVNRGIDLSTGEAATLTVPLKNSRNEMVAVLQILNRENSEANHSTPGSRVFDTADESLIASFATQAAICLETVDLYADIQRLFEGFVRASITAIESRDPSTGGHSERVARMTISLARATSECAVGIYRSVRFKEVEIRELEYAALLHDFGKIGVREEVLVKAKKLYPYQLESIRERVKVFKAAAKIKHLEEKLRQGENDLTMEREYQKKLQELESYWQIVQATNEPTVLHEENFQVLARIRNEQFLLPDGSHMHLLSEEEFNALSVPLGSLTDNERLEIESHVRHTYQFLKMIPWTKDFRHLSEIAFCHHEKLDGSGYPRGLFSQEIPLQSKIMTIADIYDALTAADRWYKEAVPPEKALEILAEEVAQGKLDPILFELFLEKKIYELTQPKLMRQGVA